MRCNKDKCIISFFVSRRAFPSALLNPHEFLFSHKNQLFIAHPPNAEGKVVKIGVNKNLASRYFTAMFVPLPITIMIYKAPQGLKLVAWVSCCNSQLTLVCVGGLNFMMYIITWLSWSLQGRWLSERDSFNHVCRDIYGAPIRMIRSFRKTKRDFVIYSWEYCSHLKYRK